MNLQYHTSTRFILDNNTLTLGAEFSPISENWRCELKTNKIGYHFSMTINKITHTHTHLQDYSVSQEHLVIHWPAAVTELGFAAFESHICFSSENKQVWSYSSLYPLPSGVQDCPVPRSEQECLLLGVMMMMKEHQTEWTHLLFPGKCPTYVYRGKFN